MEATTQQYVVRTQSTFANTYGLGEVISEGVTLFRAGNYDLSWEELQSKMAKVAPRRQG
jgi:hypothetical protein